MLLTLVNNVTLTKWVVFFGGSYYIQHLVRVFSACYWVLRRQVFGITAELDSQHNLWRTQDFLKDV